MAPMTVAVATQITLKKRYRLITLRSISRTRTSTSSGNTSDILTMDNSGSESGKMTDDENVTHTYTERTHGNIGVTTSQQVIQSERDLVRYDFYMEIVNSFKKEFCLLVY